MNTIRIGDIVRVGTDRADVGLVIDKIQGSHNDDAEYSGTLYRVKYIDFLCTNWHFDYNLTKL